MSSRVSAPRRQLVTLGGGLRPIVFGGCGGAADGSPANALKSRPELTLSVHAPAGEFLGYAVIDRATPRTAWGAMTICEHLSLEDACSLARSTTLQLALFSIRAGSHHCLMCVADDASEGERSAYRRAYADALRPLVEAGLCRIIFTSEHGRSEPRLARDGMSASAAASALATLEYLRIDPTSATAALYRPGELGRDLRDELVERGVRFLAEGDEALTAGADLVLVDGSPWSLRPHEAVAIRAKAVISLAPVAVSVAAERRLHARGIVLVPETLAAAGAVLAADFAARGRDDAAAVARTFSAVDDRFRALARLSLRRRQPLAAVVRACARTSLAGA